MSIIWLCVVSSMGWPIALPPPWPTIYAARRILPGRPRIWGRLWDNGSEGIPRISHAWKRYPGWPGPFGWAVLWRIKPCNGVGSGIISSWGVPCCISGLPGPFCNCLRTTIHTNKGKEEAIVHNHHDRAGNPNQQSQNDVIKETRTERHSERVVDSTGIVV